MKKRMGETQSERLHQAIRHRQDQQKQELRQAILNAAGELFLEQGYDRFSLRKVAERIGYSPTTIYLYFRDKDDLLFTVVDEGFARFRQQIAAAAAGTQDCWQRLIALGRAYMTFGLENPVYYQLMFMQRTDFLTRKPAGKDQPRIAAFQVLRQAVQEAIDAGVLRPGDAECYSNVLWAVVHGMVSLAISLPTYYAPHIQRTMEVAWQIECEGLCRH
ncbi:MAG: TetR/AcrR family transcriptional regulator [Ktedonobacteraceae bacterium]|nr:TetR/AcrR family transcriptional regulator [Ktedonobacteraceae bacterium]